MTEEQLAKVIEDARDAGYEIKETQGTVRIEKFTPIRHKLKYGIVIFNKGLGNAHRSDVRCDHALTLRGEKQIREVLKLI